MKYTTFVGLDVHKSSITVAVAKEGREAAESLGTIVNWENSLLITFKQCLKHSVSDHQEMPSGPLRPNGNAP